MSWITHWRRYGRLSHLQGYARIDFKIGYNCYSLTCPSNIRIHNHPVICQSVLHKIPSWYHSHCHHHNEHQSQDLGLHIHPVLLNGLIPFFRNEFIIFLGIWQGSIFLHNVSSYLLFIILLFKLNTFNSSWIPVFIIWSFNVSASTVLLNKSRKQECEILWLVFRNL